MKYTVRKSVIYVVGKIWMPAITCSQQITVNAYDVGHLRDGSGKITRESVEQWLDKHTGDFRSVQDFSASIEDGDITIDIPWASEDGEMAYLDTLPSED